jgi:hypothetical protein
VHVADGPVPCPFPRGANRRSFSVICFHISSFIAQTPRQSSTVPLSQGTQGAEGAVKRVIYCKNIWPVCLSLCMVTSDDVTLRYSLAGKQGALLCTSPLFKQSFLVYKHELWVAFRSQVGCL